MLTDTQLQTLADDLAANTDQVVIDALASGNNNILTSWYNQQASPDFYLWKIVMATQQMRDEYFDWSEIVTNMTTNALLALQLLIDQDSINPSNASIRAAFLSIFSGPNLVNTRTALTNGAKRLATNIQKLFSSGVGSSADPAVAAVESVSLDDIRGAVALIGV